MRTTQLCLSCEKSYLRKYGVQASAVFGAFVIDKAQLAKQHRKHAKVLLEFSQPVLVGVGMVSDSIRELRSNRGNVVFSKLQAYDLGSADKKMQQHTDSNWLPIALQNHNRSPTDNSPAFN